MTETIEMIYSTIPFIIGLIAIGIIPSKEKILKLEVTSFGPELHIGIYILAFIPLVMGFYYSMSLFTETIEEHFLDLFNAIFLIVIALGIMGINYRNYSLFSETKISQQTGFLGGTDRVELAVGQDMQEVQTIHEVQAITPKSNAPTRMGTYPWQGAGASIQPRTKPETKIQMVGCPKCGTAIKVDVSVKPVKISCPSCGIEGVVQ